MELVKCDANAFGLDIRFHALLFPALQLCISYKFLLAVDFNSKVIFRTKLNGGANMLR